jgi:hypothetical protein
VNTIMNFAFHKRRDISGSAQLLSASEETSGEGRQMPSLLCVLHVSSFSHHYHVKSMRRSDFLDSCRSNTEDGNTGLFHYMVHWGSLSRVQG